MAHGGQGASASDGRPGSGDEVGNQLEPAAPGSAPDVNQAPAHLETIRRHQMQAFDPGTGEVLQHYWAEQRSGPLPMPSDLAAYEAVQRGFAERIMRMAEKEQDHRQKIEELETRQPYWIARRGQYLGLFALALIEALAGYLAFLGHTGWALAVTGLNIFAIVAVFVTGNSESKGKAEDKQAGNEEASSPPELAEGDQESGEALN